MVYKNGPTGTWDEVPYLDRGQFRPDRHDVCLNIKSWEVAPKIPTLYLTNETDIDRRDVSAYDCVILPSRWAKANLRVNNPHVEVLPHGYSDLVHPGKKIRGQCLYSSSPDRGLDHLLRVWPEVFRHHPTASLILTYGIEGDFGPGITALGTLDRAEMADLYASTDIWVHPCTGGELFGVAGIEAQVAECVPLYFPTMALSETVREGVASSPETLGADLADLLEDEAKKEEIRGRLRGHTFVDWDESTNQLEKLLTKYS